MQIRYNTKSGLILEAQSHVSHELVAKDGELIEEYTGPEIVRAGMLRDSDGSFRQKTKQERSDEHESKKSPKTKRLDKLKKKEVITLAEVTEILKLHGLA